jgi:hypothetical protein
VSVVVEAQTSVVTRDYLDARLSENKVDLINDSAVIFAKACFGHPSPSKRQKLRGNPCLRRPQPSCYARHLALN